MCLRLISLRAVEKWFGRGPLASIALPFHLACGGKVDLIQRQIHYFPLLSGDMAAHKERLPSSESKEDVALFDSVTDSGLDWAVEEPWEIASRYVDSLVRDFGQSKIWCRIAQGIGWFPIRLRLGGYVPPSITTVLLCMSMSLRTLGFFSRSLVPRSSCSRTLDATFPTSSECHCFHVSVRDGMRYLGVGAIVTLFFCCFKIQR